MSRVAVTGAAGRLGERVVARLRATEHDVVAIDVVDTPQVVSLDLIDGDIKEAIADTDIVVHVASTFDGVREAHESARLDLQATSRLLEAAAAVKVRRFVLLSSAMVYGAWPTNPVPLTEASPVRPNPEFSFAVTKAEQERISHDWQAETGAELVVLRPSGAGADGEISWVTQAMRAASALGVDGDEALVQYLHLDDLAAAVVAAVNGQLVGTYNVAPDDWVAPEVARSLEGTPPRLQVSESLAGRVASFRWRYRLAQTPPGVLPYTMHPWVVANGRLTATGWRPRYSTEQTIVHAFPAKPWAMVSPKRRQELALGGAAAVVAASVAGATALARHLRR